MDLSMARRPSRWRSVQEDRFPRPFSEQQQPFVSFRAPTPRDFFPGNSSGSPFWKHRSDATIDELSNESTTFDLSPASDEKRTTVPSTFTGFVLSNDARPQRQANANEFTKDDIAATTLDTGVLQYREKSRADFYCRKARSLEQDKATLLRKLDQMEEQELKLHGELQYECSKTSFLGQALRDEQTRNLRLQRCLEEAASIPVAAKHGYSEEDMESRQLSMAHVPNRMSAAGGWFRGEANDTSITESVEPRREIGRVTISPHFFPPAGGPFARDTSVWSSPEEGQCIQSQLEESGTAESKQDDGENSSTTSECMKKRKKKTRGASKESKRSKKRSKTESEERGRSGEEDPSRSWCTIM